MCCDFTKVFVARKNDVARVATWPITESLAVEAVLTVLIKFADSEESSSMNWELFARPGTEIPEKRDVNASSARVIVAWLAG